MIHGLASWRQKARFCHANALAQQLFLTVAWQGLWGIMLESWSEEKLSAQMAAAEITTTTLARCKIHSKTTPPKLGRCSLNLETFREIVGVVRPGVQYAQTLQVEQHLAWLKVGGARKLARRLLIDGKASLRSTFLSAYEHCEHNVAKICFSE